MCMLCDGVTEGCTELECGALPRLDENGRPRMHYMHWFSLGQIPCSHVLARHDSDCAIAVGWHCSCDDEDEDE